MRVQNPKSEIGSANFSRLGKAVPPAALCGATCIMLVLSFPVADVWPLAYVSLVPWFLVIAGDPPWRAVLYSWVLGLVFFGIEVSWLRFVTIPGWVSLAFYLALYFPAFAVVVHLLRSQLKLGFIIAGPLCWVGLEYVRSFMLSGFGWFYMGHTQYKILPAIQIADLGGAYAVSFVVVLVNGAIADVLLLLRTAYPSAQKRSRVAWALGAAAAVVLVTWAYGVYRLKEYEPIIGPKICTIQGDIPQRIKDDPGSAQDVLGAYMRISQAGLGQGAAMLVWPETMVPGFLNLAVEDRWRVDSKELNDLSHRCLQALADLARRARARLLVGGQCLALAGRLEQNAELTRFNSAYYIEAKDSEDSVSFLGRYDKVELVPFGEYTPLKRYFPFLARMVPYEVGFSAGRDIAIFDLAGTRFGVLICYEDTIPRLVRRFRLEGAQFLVNISNDGWFEGSMELDAHLAICVFRAVENRVGIVRSVNTGVSGFISPTGKIEGVVSRHGRRKNVEGVLTQNVKLDRRETFYTHYGDWLGRVCMLVMGCLLILCIAVRIKKAIEA